MAGNNADIGHGGADAQYLQQDANFRFQQLVANGIFDQAVDFLDDIQDQINADIPAVNDALEDHLNANIAAANAAIAAFGHLLEEISDTSSKDSGYSSSLSELSDVSHFSSFSGELRYNEQCHFGFLVLPEHVAHGDIHADTHEPVHDGRAFHDVMSKHRPDDIDIINAYYNDALSYASSNTNIRHGDEDETASVSGFEQFLEAERAAKVDIIQWMHNGIAKIDRPSTSKKRKWEMVESLDDIDDDHLLYGLTTSQSDTAVLTTSQSDTAVLTTSQSDTAVLTTSQSDTGVLTTSQSDTGVLTTSQSDTAVLTTSQSDTAVLTTSQSDTAVLTTSQSDTAASQCKKRRRIMGVKKSNSAVHVNARVLTV